MNLLHRSAHSTVYRDGDTVVKVNKDTSFDLNKEKKVRTYLANVGIIYPEILAHDDNKVTYRYHAGVSFKDVYARSLCSRSVDSTVLNLLGKVAQALSELHKHKGDTDNQIDLTKYDIEHSAPVVCTHGDCTPGNILVHGTDIIVLDASSNSYINPKNGSSTKYYDVSQFIAGLACVFPLKYHVLANKSVIRKYIQTFIDQYEGHSGERLDSAILDQYVTAHLRAYAGFKKREKHITSIVWRGILDKKLKEVNCKMADYRESHQQLGAVYDDVLDNKFENVLLDVEKTSLQHIFQKYNLGTDSTVLDFACGTGRITSYLTNHFNKITGVDVSESMLSKAKQRCDCTFILQDVTATPLEGSYDLLTSFRFFLNANVELRNDVLKSLKNNLNKDSLFVFNIHGNRNSLLGLIFWIQKRLGMKGVLNTMSFSQVKKLLDTHGYSIVEYRGIGLLPGRKNVICLPRKLLVKFESVIGKIPVFRYFCKDYLFVVKLK